MELPSTPQNFKTILLKGYEGKLSKNGSIKVRSFPGSTVDDMLFDIIPILKKRPNYLIIHVRTTHQQNF